MPTIITLLTLGFVIFIHELGHLFAAKRARVGVSEFAVGMGPKIASFMWGNTLYSLRILPFGGFVKVKGMNDDDCPIEEDYRQKSALQRASILGAGSFMNIILGLVTYIAIAYFVGQPVVSNTIQAVVDGSPAQTAGIQVSDQLIAINNQPVEDVHTDAIQVIRDSEGAPITLTINRNQSPLNMTVSAQKGAPDQPYQLGISFETQIIKHGFFESISVGFSKTVSTISQSFLSIKMLVTGQAGVSDLAGPVGLVQLASSQIQNSMVAFLGLMALISISLGIINLFPFPVLDGGHLMFLLIEVLRGKPLNKNVETILNNMAAVCLIGLMAFVVFNDVISWNDRVDLIKEMVQ